MINLKDRTTTQGYPRFTNDMLEPFRTVTLGIQDVRLLNVGKEWAQYAQDLKKAMGPKTIWTYALAWHLFEMVRDLKKQADDTVSAGRHVQAQAQYHAIWTMFDMCSIFHFDHQMYTQDVTWVLSRLDAIIMESAIGESLICIAEGTLEPATARSRLELIQRATDHAVYALGVGRGLPAAVQMLAFWPDYILRFLLFREEATLQVCEAALSILVNQSKTVLQQSEAGISEYFKFDLARITDHIHRPELRAVYFSSSPLSFNLLCRCLSVCHLGIPTIAPQTTVQKPAHIDDLIDWASYAQLVAEEAKSGAESM